MQPTMFKHQSETTPILDDEEDVQYGSAESDILSNDSSNDNDNNNSSSYTAEDLLDEHCCSANDESSVASSALDSQGIELDADEEDEDVDVDDSSDLNDPDPDHGSSLLLAKDKDNNSNSGGATGAQHFFEGAEKRLAIYFKHSDQQLLKQDVYALDLRRITRAQWTKILELVHCKILNVITNEHYHAYLLSESSLFVAKKFLMLKTCGSTTLLDSLEMILDVVFNCVGFDSIEDVYYSHKNLLLPRLQKKPHDSFINECQHLDKVFEGMAHVFGQINSDRWYLYIQHDQHDQHHYGYPNQKLNPGQLGQGHGQPNPPGSSPSPSPSFLVNKNEHFKFEMIMEKLDPAVMQWFYYNPLSKLSAAQVTKQSGIDSIIPGMVIDEFLFKPCGYSMNGLLGKYYMTIHISPEAEFSYVSLETNVPQKNYPQFIEKVLQIFKPGKFMLNLFVPNFNYLKSIHYQQQLNELIECSALGGGGGGGTGADGGAIVVGGAAGGGAGADGDDSDNGSSLVVSGNDDDENDRNNNSNSGNRSSPLTTAPATPTPATPPAASLDSSGKINGIMLFEAFSQQPSITIGYNHFHVNHYRRYDFQMVQSEHLDIIYARYVNEEG